MNLTRLFRRELSFRRGHSLLGLLAVSLTVGVVATVQMRLDWQRADTRRVLDANRQEVETLFDTLEDEMRKITKAMGFNVMVLPSEQNLADFYANDFAAKTMPEEYVHTLANAGIITVQHLLPILQKKVFWEEESTTTLVIGVRDEVPLADSVPKSPLLQPVPAGHIVLGYELHVNRGWKKGDTITFQGRNFDIHELKPQRGNKDDITLWIPLDTAQTLFGKEDEINAILALQCKCAWADIAKVREELVNILPGTQVIEFSGRALARAEARNQAAETRKEVLERESRNRSELLQREERFAGTLIPLVSLGTMGLLATLTFLNVRDRKSEIGILRAIGLSRGRVLQLFLGKAAFLGLVGMLPGMGVAVALMTQVTLPEEALPWQEGVQTLPLLMIACLAPALQSIAAWPPAVWAANQDPATILHED